MRKGGERLKKKRKEEEEKGNGTFRSSRDHVFHSLVAWFISQPVLAFFLFQFYSPSWNEKLTGSLPFYVQGKRRREREREDVSAREATGSTCSLSLLRHCYSTKVAQNTRFPLFVTVSRPSRAYGFALRPRILSICRVEKCLDRVSFSKNFGRLTWQPSKEPTVEGMLRNVGDLFERLNTFPRFINDFNSNYWKERTSRF